EKIELNPLLQLVTQLPSQKHMRDVRLDMFNSIRAIRIRLRPSQPPNDGGLLIRHRLLVFANVCLFTHNLVMPQPAAAIHHRPHWMWRLSAKVGHFFITKGMRNWRKLLVDRGLRRWVFWCRRST